MSTTTTDQCCPDRKEIVVIGMYYIINDSQTDHHRALVTGNGPSAIVLSYILSGHIPHWNGCPVSNDYLNIKLEQYVKDSSLLEQVIIWKENNLKIIQVHQSV